MKHVSVKKVVNILVAIFQRAEDEEGFNDTEEMARIAGMEIEAVMKEFGLVWDEAVHLHYNCMPLGVYNLTDEQAPKFLDTVQEAIHECFDGWSAEDVVVITSFLQDVMIGMKAWKGYGDR
jgi:hypothetical protein